MKAARDFAVVGLGELLWDEFPAVPAASGPRLGGGPDRRLGGAPANFAVMAARLGVHGILASRLGADEAGERARALLARMPVDTRFLQTDPALPTGSVTVAMQHGQPSYTIHAPVAWDALELSPEWRELAARADAVCWGTLAQRDARAEQAIHGFLAATRPDCLRIFDINLREPFFTAEIVTRSLAKATLLKLNDSEMPHLLSLANLPAAADLPDGNDDTAAAELTAAAHRLLAEYGNLQVVAVTLGAHGSLLITRDVALRHRGIAVEVADTVGAGDAFTAALAVHCLLGLPLAVQSEAANRWGGWVASQAGAMPELAPETLRAMEAVIRSEGGL